MIVLSRAPRQISMNKWPRMESMSYNNAGRRCVKKCENDCHGWLHQLSEKKVIQETNDYYSYENIFDKIKIHVKEDGETKYIIGQYGYGATNHTIETAPVVPHSTNRFEKVRKIVNSKSKTFMNNVNLDPKDIQLEDIRNKKEIIVINGNGEYPDLHYIDPNHEHQDLPWWQWLS